MNIHKDQQQQGQDQEPTISAWWGQEELHGIVIPRSAGSVAMSMSHEQVEPTIIPEPQHPSRPTIVRAGSSWESSVRGQWTRDAGNGQGGGLLGWIKRLFGGA